MTKKWKPNSRQIEIMDDLKRITVGLPRQYGKTWCNKILKQAILQEHEACIKIVEKEIKAFLPFANQTTGRSTKGHMERIIQAIRKRQRESESNL